jgi:hypothetical protein
MSEHRSSGKKHCCHSFHGRYDRSRLGHWRELSSRLIAYDRRGTGLSERDTAPGKAEPTCGCSGGHRRFRPDSPDLWGRLGTIEATRLASCNTERVCRLVLRAPSRDWRWATIPAVRGSQRWIIWEYFTSPFCSSWLMGQPGGRGRAARFRAVADPRRARVSTLMKFDPGVASGDPGPTLVEHHPGTFLIHTRRMHHLSLIVGWKSSQERRFHDGPLDRECF